MELSKYIENSEIWVNVSSLSLFQLDQMNESLPFQFDRLEKSEGEHYLIMQPDRLKSLKNQCLFGIKWM